MTLSDEEKTAVGEAIGATPPVEKERRTVRVDLDTMKVYANTRGRLGRPAGYVTEYVENTGTRIRTKRGVSSPFVSRRLTVRLVGDPRKWVGQFKKDEKTTVILRPLTGP